ncbi:nSTAND3 domain-containing NTPase [Arthrobacter sp. D3-16]
MSKYENLSPYDFESLCRDLFTAKEGVHFETFATGRDGGIDIRYIGNGTKKDPEVIIQCKHYERSGFTALRSKMLAEKEKALGLGAKRYILATTATMTPENKSSLLNELHPLISSESDIYSQSDIDSLIRDHPQVEKSHFRLWLNSTAVLEKVLHNDIFAQTDVYLEELEQTAKTFVDHSGVADVQDMLEKQHVCIITGPAGVGKTTLANMMLIYYVGQGFEPVVASENFSEVQRVYSKESKQIFLYDDFLGRTTGLDKLGKSEDDRIANFIRAIGRSPSKRLLMTTRQYILEQATVVHEPLERPHVKQAEYFFKMKAYSKSNKAHILYNHLYFSSLSRAHKQEIVESRLYPEMVASDNFTPRAVESAIAFALKNSVAPKDVSQFLVDSIENPSELWRGQLTAQISHQQRVILAFLALEGGATDKEKLERFYLSAEGSLQEAQSFDSAMRGLEGSAIELREIRGVDSVVFTNPGVEDAVLDHVLPMKSVLRPLIGGSGYERCLVLWNHANDDSGQKQRRRYRLWFTPHMTTRSSESSRPSLQMVVDSLIAEYIPQLIPGVEALWKREGVDEEQLLNLLIMCRYADPGVSEEVGFDKLVIALIDSWAQERGAKSHASELLALLLENDDMLKDEERQRLVDAAVTFIAESPNNTPADFYAMIALTNLFELGSLTVYAVHSEPLTLQTVQQLAKDAAIMEWEGIYGKDNLHELREEVDSWRDLLDELGVDEPGAYMTAAIAVEEAEREAEGYDEGYSGTAFSSEPEDAEIHLMFSSLADD